MRDLAVQAFAGEGWLTRRQLLCSRASHRHKGGSCVTGKNVKTSCVCITCDCIIFLLPDSPNATWAAHLARQALKAGLLTCSLRFHAFPGPMQSTYREHSCQLVRPVACVKRSVVLRGTHSSGYCSGLAPDSLFILAPRSRGRNLALYSGKINHIFLNLQHCVSQSC